MFVHTNVSECLNVIHHTADVALIVISTTHTIDKH
jgi:hypothetical protein